MFANTQLGAMNFGFPDVCNTPVPPVVVPIPYPNLSTSMMGVPAVYNCFIGFTPAQNLLTTVPMSNGDNAGLALGVASALVMGPTRHVLGSFTCLIGCMPATKLTSISGHNGMSMNVPGLSVFPSQFQTVILT